MREQIVITLFVVWLELLQIERSFTFLRYHSLQLVTDFVDCTTGR
ncbi:7517_t:CDS:1, partial [Acaulospora morrowiae]